MRKGICSLLLIILLLWPNLASAANCLLNINVIRQEDGTTCSELVINNQIFWRLTILTDGARPVTGSYSARTILIAPDITNGLFLIRVQ